MNVAWGLIKLGLGSEHQCKLLLQLVDRHLDSGGSADLAVALDCFAAAKYSSITLTPARVAKLMGWHFMEASGQNITRYLCLCPSFGVGSTDLKMQLAERLIQVAAEPQDCANAVLALAR